MVRSRLDTQDCPGMTEQLHEKGWFIRVVFYSNVIQLIETNAHVLSCILTFLPEVVDHLAVVQRGGSAGDSEGERNRSLASTRNRGQE